MTQQKEGDRADSDFVFQPICITLRHQLKQLRQPIIVGVAGDSGSGKTNYSDGIRRLIGIDLVDTIAMDGYHKKEG